MLFFVSVAQPQAVGVVPKSAFTRLDGRPESNVGLKRKLEIAEPRLREPSVESSDDGVKTKKKRYVLVRTMPNGAQDRTYISPDDPILKKVRFNFQSVSTIGRTNHGQDPKIKIQLQQPEVEPSPPGCATCPG